MAARTAASTIQRAAVAVSSSSTTITPQLPPHALLSKCLVAPSQIASKLNWQHQRRAMNKNQSAVVLTLDIHKNRIEATLASHPSLGRQQQQQQASDGCTTTSSQAASSSSPQETTIPYHFQGGKLPQYVKDQLEDLIQQQRHPHPQHQSRSKSKSPNVVGVLVSWPVQKDTGHMGAPCGRTLHVVEELLQQETTLFGPTTSRPLAFWDAHHHHHHHHHALTCGADGATTACHKTDAWGRCPEYSRTTHKDHIHRASVEQYHQDEDLAVQQVWEDFCKVHWPSLVVSSSVSAAKGEEDEDTTTCLELEEEEETRAFA